MPNKDRNKRIETRRIWDLRNPKKLKQLRRIQRIAAYYNPIRQKCSIAGCENIGERHHPDYSKPKEIIWLCKKHHEDIHRKNPVNCSTEGCLRNAWAKGLCHPCYKKIRRLSGIRHGSA